VILVALVAATDNIEELPEVIEVGLAAILTVGADGVGEPPLKCAPPQPAMTSRSGNNDRVASGDENQRVERWARAFVNNLYLLIPGGGGSALSIIRSMHRPRHKAEVVERRSVLYRNGFYSMNSLCAMPRRR
jgi:hypothetical protein